MNAMSTRDLGEQKGHEETELEKVQRTMLNLGQTPANPIVQPFGESTQGGGCFIREQFRVDLTAFQCNP